MKCVAAGMMALALLTGCDKDPEPVAFALVGDVPITEQMVKEAVLVQAKMRELSGNPVPAGEFVEWANRTAIETVAPLINFVLMEKEISRTRTVAETQDVARVLSSYNRKLKRNASTPEELAAEFGKWGEPFLQQFHSSARLAAYERIHWSPRASDDNVSRYFQRMTNECKRAQAIDDRAWARAREAYGKLKAGMTWEEAAEAYSEDKLINPENVSKAKMWMSFAAGGTGFGDLVAAVKDLKVGEFSKPVENSSGLMILRLVGKKRDVYRVARIYFRMARPIVIPSDFEAARRRLSERMSSTRRKQTLEWLQKSVQITYPMGTNVTYRIWKETSYL